MFMIQIDSDSEAEQKLVWLAYATNGRGDFMVADPANSNHVRWIEWERVRIIDALLSPHEQMLWQAFKNANPPEESDSH